MSALYGSLEGERGKEVTKRGFKRLSGHVRGWDSGVKVEAIHDDDGDTFLIYQTGGSTAVTPDILLGKITNGKFRAAK